MDMVGAADLFPASGFYHTKGLGFFTIWEGLCPLGGENSAWTHLELLQQSIVWMQIHMALGEEVVGTTLGSLLMKCVIQHVRDIKKIVCHLADP